MNSIINHWKISKEILDKLKIVEIPSNKNINKVCTLKINNSKLIPNWAFKENQIFIKCCNSDLKGNDCNVDNYSLLESSKNEIKSNFNNVVNDLLNENYIVKKQPFYTKFPIPYYYLPYKIGLPLFKMFMKSRNKKVDTFPAWPNEYSVELMRYLFIKELSLKLNKGIPYIGLWPDNKDFAFSLSHDIESETGFKNIEMIREIEKRYDFKSSWNVVPYRYKIDFAKLKELEKEGCEVGIHGYNHDGKLPFLKKNKIEKKVKKGLNRFNDFNIKGFRSPSLFRTNNLFEVLSKNYDYDSSIQDTDINSPVHPRCGCCSVFPYFINNMVELPITLPQDTRLVKLNYNDELFLNTWKEKTNFIKKLNGFVFLLLHPDTHMSGTDKYLNIYEKYLKEMSKMDNCWSALPKEVSNWWRERNNLEIKGNKIVGKTAYKAVIKTFK
ncbi:MAG: DUF2334 domain-containing protein [Candidatus Nanoarchaeia archaeon]|nr:DUF2334 domain-containing protein [Candidatus Nanoarchaeia archaeon]